MMNASLEYLLLEANNFQSDLLKVERNAHAVFRQYRGAEKGSSYGP